MVVGFCRPNNTPSTHTLLLLLPHGCDSEKLKNIKLFCNWNAERYFCLQLKKYIRLYISINKLLLRTFRKGTVNFSFLFI